ncbi:MAG: dipeptidase [Pseudomonadota bacterium]|nr:dipeptidase [Pseudomonadota bacterium]
MEITRRSILASGAALAAMPLAAKAPKARPGDGYDRMIVIDGLGGIGNPGEDDNVTRINEANWRAYRDTGVTAVRVTVMPVGNFTDAWQQYRDSIVFHDAIFGANPGRFRKVVTSADIVAAKTAGQVAIILGTQDTSMVGPDLDRLATMKKDGILSVQLTYNNRNLSGDGAIEPANAGLSKLGRATIERIEAEKLLLDLSHGGARTMADAVAHAKRPLVISHTGARALADHPRNTSDETMRAVANKGGVVGLYFMPYLTPKTFRDTSGEHLLMVADHMLKTLGEDHIAIGTDNGPLPTVITPESKAALDKWQQTRIDQGIAAPGESIGWYPWIEAYNSIDRYRRFANDLVKRGWTQTRVEKLMGGNFLRVYREAWGG